MKRQRRRKCLHAASYLPLTLATATTNAIALRRPAAKRAKRPANAAGRPRPRTVTTSVIRCT